MLAVETMTVLLPPASGLRNRQHDGIAPRQLIVMQAMLYCSATADIRGLPDRRAF